MVSGWQTLKTATRTRFLAWLDRRIPPARSVTLDQKRIFIFPSRVGFFFFACLLLMLLTAINYESNLSFGLTFLLTTLFIVAVLHTYANLSGMTVHGVRAQSVFPGQQAEFELLLERGKRRDHYALHVAWENSDDALVNIVEQDTQTVRLHIRAGERGWFNPGRLLIETSYPLGLLRCWTWVALDLNALVYPRPLACPAPAGISASAADGTAVMEEGSDDFYGFRDYRAGDSLRQVYWKGLARGQALQSKQYAAYADRSVWLDWEQFEGVGIEQRLSQLCFWVLELEGGGEEYGLRIPGATVSPGRGEKQRDDALRALALYGQGDTA